MQTPRTRWQKIRQDLHTRATISGVFCCCTVYPLCHACVPRTRVQHEQYFPYIFLVLPPVRLQNAPVRRGALRGARASTPAAQKLLQPPLILSTPFFRPSNGLGNKRTWKKPRTYKGQIEGWLFTGPGSHKTGLVLSNIKVCKLQNVSCSLRAHAHQK